jgi:DNA-directed RNA polymerase specialized sigma24 family protein
MPLRVHRKPERNAEILRLATDGLRYREIASRFGIVTSRVGFLIKAERDRLLKSPETDAFVRKICAANSLEKKEKNRSG